MGRHRKLSFLPKVTSPATFLSPPPSPIRVNSRKVCSSPIVLVPKEVRRKGKGGSFESKEPTSPKVSCMGQVTCKNKLKKKKKRTEEQEHHGNIMLVPLHKVVIKLFKAKSQGEKRAQDSPPGVQRVLSLGHAKRLSSGRGVLQNFDWRAHDIGDGSCHDGPNDCANGRSKHQFQEEEEEEEEEEAIAVEPRKDVNLWKRRNMSPPQPLKL